MGLNNTVETIEDDLIIKTINKNSENNNYNKQYLPRKIIIRQIDIKQLQDQININFNNTSTENDNDLENQDNSGDSGDYYDMFGNVIRKTNQEYRGFNRNVRNDDQPKNRKISRLSETIQ